MILDLELSTPQGTTFNHIIAVYFVRGLSDGATMFPAARLVGECSKALENPLGVPSDAADFDRSWRLDVPSSIVPL